MTLPTLSEIEALHRKYAPNDELFHTIYEHCQIVAEIADELYKPTMSGVERDVVHAGCLLHDIGVYKLYANGEPDERQYIRHGVLGYDVLKAEGFDERVCRFCSHHTGVGLGKEYIIARNFPLPHEDFYADTDEELLIMYADKFHSKGIAFTERATHFNTAEAYTKYVARFGEEDATRFKEMVARFGVPDLEALSKKYGNEIV